MANRKTEKKEKLVEILTDTKVAAEGVVSKAQNIIKEGQFTVDVATHLKGIVVQIPDDSFLSDREWNDQIEAWSLTRQLAGGANNALGSVPFAMSTVSSSNSTSGTISYTLISSLPFPFRDKALNFYEKYQQDLTARDSVSEIKAECVRLGLDCSRVGTESVISLIHQGKQAFDVPTCELVSPSAVLIPLRSAIDRACADLLPRRPTQKKTGGLPQKIMSICEQCRYSNVDPGRIRRLENQAPALYDDLSKTKDAIMTREQVRELMNRAFLFLLDFLQTIDESKLQI